MDSTLKQIKKEVYDKCSLEISDFKIEAESKEYDASRFELSGRIIICRKAKVTPKKAGQFVTFWKRKENGPIEPFHVSDRFDYYVVNVQTEKESGQFVFPKSVLIRKGIVSTENKEGKRAVRVYPSWDVTKSKQAQQTQKWQLDYFFQITDSLGITKIRELYTNK